ncbi:hypothetical protein GGX14DRAFT_407453 [Mycena pura]|uniref:Uncharacterized protein n=1 Tax=Mycena pura TaxID=153505 RepID=A0AAD6UPV7_9AGAR|nr:hypothetical protein GGX14DRAFT_407453 [Mycena pura]
MSTNNTRASTPSHRRQGGGAGSATNNRHTPRHQSSAKTDSEWLEPLLRAMKIGAAAGELTSIPYNMKKNQELLRELSENIVKVMHIIQYALSLHRGSTADKLREHCMEFQKLMANILDGINQMQAKSIGVRGHLRDFFKSASITDQIKGYEKEVETFARNLQLWTQTFEYMP